MNGVMDLIKINIIIQRVMQNSTFSLQSNRISSETENVDFFTSALKKIKQSRKMLQKSGRSMRKIAPLVVQQNNKTEQSINQNPEDMGLREIGKQSNIANIKQQSTENISKLIVFENDAPVSFKKKSTTAERSNTKFTQETTETYFDHSKVIQDQRENQSTFLCKICCVSRSSSNCIILNCGHELCLECLVSWATEFLKEPKNLHCPYNNCKTTVDLKQLQLEDRLPKAAYKNYKRHILLMSLVEKPDETICPNENCQQGIIKVQKSNLTLNQRKNQINKVDNQIFFPQQEQPKATACDKCGGEFCSRCLMPLHAYVNCKSWQAQLLEIQDDHNFCQCQKCGKVIEKNSGCNHMTCKCGYQFCFVCGVRWRKFHLCNPFYHEMHRSSAGEQPSEPTCLDYLYFIVVFSMKVIWAILSLIYMIPLLLAGQIFGNVGLGIGLFLMGITYSYVKLMHDYLKANQTCLFLTGLIFPYGMSKGVALAFKTHAWKFKFLIKWLPRLIDLVLPFNWIPFSCI